MPRHRGVMEIVNAGHHRADWLRLRAALWPGTPAPDPAVESTTIASDEDAAAFLATIDGAGIGFVEVTIRRDYVNGCDTRPVAFLEGLYVDPAHRRAGVARALCAAAEAWGRGAGCTEIASDAELANTTSHVFHTAFGFAETERVVFFRKAL